MKRVTIPEHWTGEEALAVVGFLEKAIAAIWREHGRNMEEALNSEACAAPPAPPSSSDDPDEIPF